MARVGNQRRLHLGVLGRFTVCADGTEVPVPRNGQRVFAMLAVNGGSVSRSRIAGTIWAETTETRAQANLRTTLWRLPALIRPSLERHGSAVTLSQAWEVDIDDVVAAASRLAQDGMHARIDPTIFTDDLLPSWDVDWLVVRRERHRQLRLHALEVLATAQLSEGQCFDAVDTALQAVDAEPLRESAQILLLRAHTQAGNRIAVVRQYEAFRTQLFAALGVEPGFELKQLVAEASQA